MRTELSDEQFLARFNDLSLSPDSFDHRGHLRIAWIHLQRYPLEEAIARLCAGIRAFATHLGATGKFNHTLTEALLRIMHAAGGADRRLSWEDFLGANPELVRNARGLLERHYSQARLMSEEARAGFVTPDREALP